MPTFSNFWTLLYMGTTPRAGPIPTILSVLNGILQTFPLVNFLEDISSFVKFTPIYLSFWTPLHMWTTPRARPIFTTLSAVKNIVKISPIGNFQEDISINSNFMPIFVKFWTTPYMGTTPKNGPIRFIFKLDLLVVLKSICAKFGSDSSTPSARKVFTDRRTDRRTCLDRFLYWCWSRLYILCGVYLDSFSMLHTTAQSQYTLAGGPDRV